MTKTIAILSIAGLSAAASAAETATFDFDIEFFGNSPEVVIDSDVTIENVASIKSISIDISHSWAGDMVFRISNSTGGTFLLMNGIAGSSSDLGLGGGTLSDVQTYTFVESGSAAGGVLGTGGTAAGEYDAFNWGNGSPFSSDWNIFLEDDAGGDDGAVGSISIVYNLVPAPGAFALLGAGGLVAARRRRA